MAPSLAHEEIAIADQGGVDSAGTKQQESIAEAQGALEFQQNLDELNTSLHDPVVAEVRSEELRDGDPATVAQVTQQEQQEQVGALVSTAVFAAAANSDFLIEHDLAAEQERDQLGGMIQSQQQVVADLQTKYAQSQERLKADLDFQHQMATAMRQRLVDRGMALPSAHQVTRACGGAANDQDLFALQMDASSDRIILLGRASFDRGGDEDLVFRRIQGTSQWTATAYWPLESSKAKISLALGTRWSNIGEVEAGRPSVEQQLEDARKAIGQLKTRKRAASYSADGGDEGRTTIIP